MWFWTVMSMANAQVAPGGSLADDPDYDTYATAVEDLGLPLALPPRDGGFQIAIGTMGVIRMGSTTVGHVMAIPDPNDASKGRETMVLYRNAHVEDVNDGFWQIGFQKALQPGDQTSVDQELAQLDSQDPQDLYVATSFVIRHKTLPDTDGAELALVTPDTNPGQIELLGFRVWQGGEVRGWMLRERRDLGADGILWVDHWLYTTDYAFPDQAGEALSLVPDGIAWGSIPGVEGSGRRRGRPGRPARALPAGPLPVRAAAPALTVSRGRAP